MPQEIQFELHAKQQQAWKHLEDPSKRDVVLLSGVQGGKTIFGCFAMRWLIEELHQNKPYNWVIGAPTYKIMEQSTLPTFKKIFGPRLGNYNGKDAAYNLKEGGVVYFRTSTDPDAVEGIPDCKGGWMDEAGKCSRQFWVNFQGRVARLQGKLIFTTTWYNLGWLYKEIWKPWKEHTRSDIGLVYFNSAENPTFPSEELERQRQILSRTEFSRKYLGEPSKPEGLIFPDFGEQNIIEPFNLPDRTTYYAGLDWGFDHPTAMVIRAFPGDGKAYTVSVFKERNLSASQQIDMIKAKCRLYNVKMIYAGHDRPEMIKELNAQGIPCVKYFEGNQNFREVNAGNSKHGELIKSRRYLVFKGIEGLDDLEEEYATYQWDRDEDVEYTQKEKPRNINDDLMAAERYCTVGTWRVLTRMAENPNIMRGVSKTKVDTSDFFEDGNKGWDSY